MEPATTTEQPVVPLAHCGDIFVRWWYNGCRCPEGSFDGAWYRSDATHPCMVVGREVWKGGWLICYWWVLIVFAVPLVWSLVRAARLLHMAGFQRSVRALMSLQALRATMGLQAVVLTLSITSTALRFLYVLSEDHAVKHASPSVDTEQRYNGQLPTLLFSAFFPVAASLILSLSYYWQVLLRRARAVNQEEAKSRSLEAPARIAFLVIVEAVHELFSLVAPSKALDTIFILWSLAALLAVSVQCLVIARNLHSLVCASLPYSRTSVIFNRLRRGPRLIVAVSAGICGLMLVDVFVSQWYAWTWLLTWTLARTCEALLISASLWTIGYIMAPTTSQDVTQTKVKLSDSQASSSLISLQQQVSLEPSTPPTPTPRASISLPTHSHLGPGFSTTPNGSVRQSELLVH